MQRLFFADRGRMTKIVLLLVLITIFAVSAVWAAVTLQNFEGHWGGNRVTLIFSTGSEIDHSGFHVWRSEFNLDPENVNSTTATRLTTSPIIGNPCEALGFDYEYEDTTVDTTEYAYYYYLESLGCSSSAPEFFGSMDNPHSGLEVVVNPNAPQLKYKTYAPVVKHNSPAPIPTPEPTPIPMPTSTPTPLIWPTSTPNPIE